MQMKVLDWDGLNCLVPQDYIDRGFNLAEGTAPWSYVEAGDDLRIQVTESWICEKAGWMFVDVDLSFEQIVLARLKDARENSESEKSYNREKIEFIAALNNLIKKIESF